MAPSRQEYIRNYYRLQGKKALILDSGRSVLRVFLARRNTVVLSDSRLIRGAAKLRRLPKTRTDTAFDLSLQFFAMLDAVKLLYQKGVPVYFYNRVGKEKTGFEYSAKEKARMEAKLSFPLMYEDIGRYEAELRDVFGDLYSREYVEEMGRIPQVIRVGNTYQHEDFHSRYINVENGKRITAGQPEHWKRTIHVYGRCGAFGYAVEDRDTIPSLLQKELLSGGITDIRVVNHGLWGGDNSCLNHNFLQESVGMKQGDIVLFYRAHFNKRLMAELEKCGMRYREITQEWHERKTEEATFFDRPGHMNAGGYRLAAKLLCEDLVRTGFSCGPADPRETGTNAESLNYYLKTRKTDDFEKEIREYTDGITREYPLTDSTADNGAIVMNCNPFTRGHRYLIEKAAAQTDRLYIFVVEENKSFFRFEDRLEMVRNGTKDIGNVAVVPSGKFIISAYTFPEYFMKDYVKEKNFDVSMDVETFCRHIAPPLRIRTRFAGEEPFDPVTRNYNENMKRILPQYGMRFEEIPRYTLDGGQVISATKVRELLKNREYDALKEYVPESTFTILMDKYAD